jgi:hypothetical protein
MYSALSAIANTFFNQHWSQEIFYSPLLVKLILIVVLLFWAMRNVNIQPFKWLSASH